MIRSTPREQIESLALKLSFGLAGLAWLASYIFTLNTSLVPVYGYVSQASILLSLSVLITFVVFQVGYDYGLKITHQITNPSWTQRFHGFTLSIAYTIFYLGLGGLLVFFIDNAFSGLQLDTITTATIAAAAAAIVTYTSFQLAANIDSMAIIHTLFAFLLVGVSISMVFNSDPYWWQHNFSTLGQPNSNTWWLFNFTLILSGLLMLTLTDYLFRDLQSAIPGHIGQVRNVVILRLFFVIIAICLTMIGLVPYVDQSVAGFIHNLAANALAINFMIVIAGIQLLLPEFSRTFYLTSYAFGATLIGLYVILFHHLGYLSLTAFELLAFIVCFVWLYLLLKTITARKLDTSEGNE